MFSRISRDTKTVELFRWRNAREPYRYMHMHTRVEGQSLTMSSSPCPRVGGRGTLVRQIREWAGPEEEIWPQNGLS